MENKKPFLIVSHNSRFLVQFELNNIALLQSMGYEVHCATNQVGETMIKDACDILRSCGVIIHIISIERSPFEFIKNIRAYKQLVKIMNSTHFYGVHCHTPMGGMIGRLAAKATNTKPVLYTAHGFHFYNGCAPINRLIYETVERFLARYTDAQITINKEDYATAKTFSLRGKAYYVHGVGVETKRNEEPQVNQNELRSEFGIPENSFLFISIGELNKNHSIVMRAFAQAKITNSYYIVCGVGSKKDYLLRLAKKLNIENNVKLLGFCKNVKQILKISDCFIISSYREGLSVSLMEAMAEGKPCIATKIRGNVDLLGENYKYLYAPTDAKALATAMIEVQEKQKELGDYAKHRVADFDERVVSKEMEELYFTCLCYEGELVNV